MHYPATVNAAFRTASRRDLARAAPVGQGLAAPEDADGVAEGARGHRRVHVVVG
jgi:hypothetical protein